MIIAVNVKARHDFLDNTIGYFDEELEAYQIIQLLAIGFPFFLLLATILQFILYYLYNRKFHPFIEMAKLKFKGISSFSNRYDKYLVSELYLSTFSQSQRKTKCYIDTLLKNIPMKIKYLMILSNFQRRSFLDLEVLINCRKNK